MGLLLGNESQVKTIIKCIQHQLHMTHSTWTQEPCEVWTLIKYELTPQATFKEQRRCEQKWERNTELGGSWVTLIPLTVHRRLIPISHTFLQIKATPPPHVKCCQLRCQDELDLSLWSREKKKTKQSGKYFLSSLISVTTVVLRWCSDSPSLCVLLASL